MALLVAFSLLGGCDPFASMTTDEDFVIPDGKGPTLELLTPKRRLPQSAFHIKGHLLQFQDPSLHVRFEAPAADAEAFLAAMMRGRGIACYNWYPDAKTEFWPKAMPSGAQCRMDHTVSDLPSILVAISPHGATATVFVHTFSD